MKRHVSSQADTQRTDEQHRGRGCARAWRSTYRTSQVLYTMRQIGVLIALVITVAMGSATATPTAFAMAPERSAANCSPGVPEKDCRTAEYVYKFAVSHNYSPPIGLKGGSPFIDKFGLLPAGGDYREYRLYSYPGSVERLVIDRSNPEGNSWFTNDHYTTFVQFYLTL